METKAKTLKDILSELKNHKKSSARELAIASRDGLVIAALMSLNKKPDAFVAMAATMFGAAETASAELEEGIPRTVIVETDLGKIIAVSAGPKALLVVIATSSSDQGLFLDEMKKSAQRIKQILE